MCNREAIHYRLLRTGCRAVNFVWNYCNDRQKDAVRFGRKWLTGFDLNMLTAGSGKELGLHSGTINAACEQYAESRAQRRRPFLRYRGRRSLGWVPFKGRDLKRHGDAFRFSGYTFRIFNSRPLPDGKIRDGSSFSRDARGKWFLNLVVEVRTPDAREPTRGVGIDLGLKEFAALSTGERILKPRHFQAFSSQVCSGCGRLPDSRPKGIADLGIRQWICCDCGALHHRDVNAALNLLARSGHRAPVEGIPAR